MFGMLTLPRCTGKMWLYQLVLSLCEFHAQIVT